VTVSLLFLRIDYLLRVEILSQQLNSHLILAIFFQSNFYIQIFIVFFSSIFRISPIIATILHTLYFQISYPNAIVLMEHLVNMGEGTASLNRSYAVGTDTFLAMAALYQGMF